MSNNELSNDHAFKRRVTHFYKKSSVVPNVVIFNDQLTDTAFRLLLALNSVPDSWVVYRIDMMKRLKWGAEKMRNAVICLEQLGYIKVTQHKDENGRFLPNIYEYDIEPVFLNNSTLENDQKCPHNEYEPRGGEPLTATPYTADPKTDDPHYSLFSEKSVSLEEQQQQAEGDTSRAAVVFSNEQNEILRLLETFNPSKDIKEIAINFPKKRTEDAIETLNQRKEKGTIANELGFLRSAIEQGWKPTEKKEVAESNKTDLVETIENHKFVATKLAQNFYDVKSKYPDKMIYCGPYGLIFSDYKKNTHEEILFTDETFMQKTKEVKKNFINNSN